MSVISPPTPTGQRFQCAGHLIVNGSSTVFLLKANGQLQATYNTGGYWVWRDLGDTDDAPVLDSALGALLAGSTASVFGLDNMGNLWMASGTSMQGSWQWQQLSALPGSVPLTTPMGVAQARGFTDAYGLDAAGNLWSCSNQGPGWGWLNVTQARVRLTGFVAGLPLPDRYSTIGQDDNGNLYVSGHVYGGGSYYMGWLYPLLPTGPAGKALAFRYVGSFTLGGLPTILLLLENGQLYGYYSKEGIWYGFSPTPPPNGLQLVTPMGAQLAGQYGETGCVFGLDYYNHLWGCYADSVTGPWSWQDLTAVRGGQPLRTFMGAAEVGGRASVFGLDEVGTLWACQNKGGQWVWTNLSAQQNGTQLTSFVALVPLGDSHAIMGVSAGNDLWSCNHSNAGDSWYWQLCGNAPSAAQAAAQAAEADVQAQAQ